MKQKYDFNDPFTAGQMIGMLLVLTFLEKNGGMPDAILQQLKNITAEAAQEFFDRPTEDVFLMVDSLVKEMI
jgi:hypothetical protein